MNQANYEAEIKILSEFIKICEKMLRQSAGMPNKEKSILSRLERCKTKLNIILACATVTTIHQKAEKLSDKINDLEEQIHIGSGNVIKEIKDHFKRPVKSNEDQINAIIHLKLGSFRILPNKSRPFAGKGILELKGGNYFNIKIDIHAPAFVLLYTLAIGSKSAKVPASRLFFGETDIIDSVASWRNNNSRYVAKVINRLKNEELIVNKVDYSNLIKTKHGHGYSICVDPQNIIIDPDLSLCLQDEVFVKKLLEKFSK